jgi:hypothetical protein
MPSSHSAPLTDPDLERQGRKGQGRDLLPDQPRDSVQLTAGTSSSSRHDLHRSTAARPSRLSRPHPIIASMIRSAAVPG